MSSLPCIPESAPFTPEQRLWLDGYLAGLFSRTAGPAGLAALPPPPPAVPVTILFGTQTGSSAILAKKLAAAARKRGFQPKVVDMAQHETLKLHEEFNLLLITSTYGEGEMPDNAQGFWQVLSSPAAPTLPRTRFSVLALGDTNYAKFCQAGKDFDARLEALGATRLHLRVDCDVEYDATFATWTEAVLTALAPPASATPISSNNLTHATTDEESVEPRWAKKNPYPTRLLSQRPLHAPGSAKEVYHFEISLGDSGLTYEAGDALGVVPLNCPALVEAILDTLHATGEEPHQGTILHQALLSHYDLAKPSPDLFTLAGLPARHGDALPAWLYGRDVLDILQECPVLPSPDTFPTLLRKLQPRLYSISSSPKAHPGQVHLSVGAVRYQAHGRSRKGVCSTFLAERAATSGLSIFFHRSPGFRLPTDPAVPIIMVGPGTGIAPFRAFLHERQATGATGSNWLFFGDQHAATDFYYQEELRALQQAGILTHLHTAFSRDQDEKIYVQHRMLEHAAELHSWLEKGAHFYVCGDASRMAKDVDQALHQIYQTAASLTPEAAAQAISTLKTQGRYQRDVY